MPVLLRPDGAVQVGWDPRRAVLVRPPGGLTAAGVGHAVAVHAVTDPDYRAAAPRADRGLADADGLANLVTQLVGAGVATECRSAARPGGLDPDPRPRAPVGPAGGGAALLGGPDRAQQPAACRRCRPHDVDLVVLSDYLVADPRMVRDLHSQGVAHLPVRVRDGIGLVGPLVIPGVTSCLGCADLHRRDRDAAWPAIAAQLRDTVGVADRATLLATAALALSQVNRVIAAVRGQQAATDPGPPQTLNATLEFDLHSGSIVARPWTRHPLCSC